MSAPHMHDDGGWTICVRDDCEVASTRCRARKIRGYFIIGVVASFALILAGTTLCTNAWGRVGIIVLCGVLYPIFLARLRTDADLRS
jgi:hypothetical protein